MSLVINIGFRSERIASV